MQALSVVQIAINSECFILQCTVENLQIKQNLADAFLSWIGQVEGFHALPSYSDIIIIVCWNSIDFVNIAFMHSVSLESGEEIIVNKIMHKYSYLYTPNSEVNNKIIGISMKDKCVMYNMIHKITIAHQEIKS